MRTTTPLFRQRATSAAAKMVKTPTSINFIGPLLNEASALDETSIDLVGGLKDAVVEYHHDKEDSHRIRQTAITNKNTLAKQTQISTRS